MENAKHQGCRVSYLRISRTNDQSAEVPNKHKKRKHANIGRNWNKLPGIKLHKKPCFWYTGANKRAEQGMKSKTFTTPCNALQCQWTRGADPQAGCNANATQESAWPSLLCSWSPSLPCFELPRVKTTGEGSIQPLGVETWKTVVLVWIWTWRNEKFGITSRITYSNYLTFQLPLHSSNQPSYWAC